MRGADGRLSPGLLNRVQHRNKPFPRSANLGAEIRLGPHGTNVHVVTLAHVVWRLIGRTSPLISDEDKAPKLATLREYLESGLLEHHAKAGMPTLESLEKALKSPLEGIDDMIARKGRWKRFVRIGSTRLAVVCQTIDKVDSNRLELGGEIELVTLANLDAPRCTR